MKTILSYTTLNNYLMSPHSYLNRYVYGIKTAETPAMVAGKLAHEVIQAHCMGVKKDARLSDLTWEFTTAEYHAKMPWDDKFTLHGYCDMIDFKSKTLCEIKTSSRPWSQKMFQDLDQWRYYGLVTEMEKVLFITCTPEITNVKTYFSEITTEDKDKARAWAALAIQGIRNGEFMSDIVDGLCTNPRCPYGVNCHWRQNV